MLRARYCTRRTSTSYSKYKFVLFSGNNAVSDAEAREEREFSLSHAQTALSFILSFQLWSFSQSFLYLLSSSAQPG